VAIQQKLLWAGPHVGTVVRHKNGRIAHQVDTLLATIHAQGLPLHPETPLHKAPETQLVSGFLLHGRQCVGVALCKGLRPGGPGATDALVEHHEHGMVVQPVAVGVAKSVEGLPVAFLGLCLKPSPGFAQCLHAVGRHALEIAVVVVKALAGHPGQPAALHQVVQIDHQRVARKGRHALVRRVARPSRGVRQDLP
jgi:hypothetical protein